MIAKRIIHLSLLTACTLILFLVHNTPAQAAGMVGSCAVFPADNPWNRDISSDPVDPNSANYIASIGASTHLHPDFGSDPTYGIPYTVVSGTQAKVPINFTEFANQSDPGPYPFPLNAPVESGSDAHSLVIDKDNCVLYELYHASPNGSGWDAGSGAVFNLKSNALRPDGWTSADAAGLPIFPGLARLDEVTAGVINHALRFTVQHTQMKYIHPATHYASSSTNPNYPPMGLRLRLKASFDLSTFTGESKVILTALKKYGMFVADNGSNWYISGVTDTHWDDNDLDQIKTVPGSAFEVVQSVTTSSGPADTIGVFRPSNHTFYLRNSNTTGPADIVVSVGDVNSRPVVGDWDGDGYDTVGVYHQNTGVFSLYNSNIQGSALSEQFVLGNPGDEPLAGRWVSGTPNDHVGRAHDGVGVFRPSNGLIYLASAWPAMNGRIYADYTIVLGNPGWHGLGGRWMPGALDTAAVYEPDTSRFWMTNLSCNGTAPGPNVFCLQYSNNDTYFGSPNDLALKGDFAGLGQDGIGVFHSSSGVFWLKNVFPIGSKTNSQADTAVVFGSPGDFPIAGHWKPLTGAPQVVVQPSDILVSQPPNSGAKATAAPASGVFD